MRVEPTSTPPRQPSGGHDVSRLVGGLWLTATLIASIYYLRLVQPPLANDLLWPHYNASGYQTFLLDLLNALLETTPDTTSVDLQSVVLETRYDSLLSTAVVHPTYAMTLLTTKLISLEFAITSLRNMSVDFRVFLLPTQYCWVDFHKMFELAHTEMRQERCRHRYVTNGAVYLESLFRNVDWKAALAETNFAAYFWFAIHSGLETSTSGARWLDAVAAVTTTSVQDEAIVWQSHGIDVYINQWQNAKLPGLVETATLANALGLQTSIVLKSFAKDQGPWTMWHFSSFFLDDVVLVGACNTSLVRSSPNYVLDTPCYGQMSASFETYVCTWPFDHQASVMRDALGPFLSIDLYVVPLPSSLIALRTISARHNSWDAATAEMYSNLNGLHVTPVPLVWPRDLLFYGGNPFCTFGAPQTYVQPPFASRDDCVAQSPWTLHIPPRSIVLALALVNDSIDVICVQQSLQECSETLLAAQEHSPRELRDSMLLQNAITAVIALNISVMQFASDVTRTNYSLLLQPLLKPPFAFYGWVLLFDWVAGVREVISLEGDNGTLVLISDAYDTTSTTPNNAVLGTSSVGLFYMLLYSTCVLGTVAIATVIASLVLRHGATNNFFVFNRVAGSTWLGRPLLLLRGGSAIVLLSSAPIDLAQPYNQFVQLALPQRQIWETCLVAWEATWVSYVVHEVFLPLRYHNARFLGVLGTALGWLCMLIMDVGWPISVTATVNRECAIVEAYYTLRCTSVVVQTGDGQRLLLLALIQGLLLPCLLLLNCLGFGPREGKPSFEDTRLPFVGQVFLTPRPPLDAAAQLASGLIPLQPCIIFDLKLWRLLMTSPTVASVQPFQLQPKVNKANRWGPRVWVLFGTLYVVAAIYSSVSYLGLARGILTNDLVWPAFNMTGSHSFLANWFNAPVRRLGAVETLTTLTKNDQINSIGQFNQSHASVAFPIQQGARVQYATLTSLSDAVSGLRTLDGCDGPWVFTQYCYLDFDQEWEMANSAKRQERCNSMVNNGAVFLASLLRNVDISACWSEEIEIGFGSELRQSAAGQALLASFIPPYLSIDDEVSYWTQKKITSYTLQWQNYKSIGLLHSYNIVNAYGVAYPFTLQSTAGYFRRERQTSFKMYWSLANDLTHLVTNSTTMGDKSLLRSGSRFAFQNASLQDVLVEAKVLPEMPWRANYVVLASYLGPFGSIDMVHVSVPSILRGAMSDFSKAVTEARHLNRTLYAAIVTPDVVAAVPQQWKNQWGLPGSVLCPDQPFYGLNRLAQLLSMDVFDATCSTNQPGAQLAPSETQALFAVHAANLSLSTNHSAMCNLNSFDDGVMCSMAIQKALPFLSLLTTLPEWHQSLYAAIRPLNIEWVQFGMVNETAPIELFRIPVLDPSDPLFHYFEWIFIYDWAIGNREVISFQGDLGTLTLLGDTLPYLVQPVDVAQLPTIFALYALHAVRYVTYVMIMLAAVTFVYILLARGHVEGLNMFEMSRVGGIVWVGRPLVAVRSITALCLLSTASIELQSDGVFSYFVTTPVPLWTTCLAANEVTWLVGIVNDILLVWTQDHTIAYATVNSLLTWLISALLATLAPVQATITVSPVCEIATLDYQVVCVAGSVVIGSLKRLLTLVGLVLVSNGVCFGLVRCLWKRPIPHVSSSMLLCGGAKYLFSHDGWMDEDGTYFLDRASAVLNGLLSVRFRGQWVVVDVKTWCVHKLEVAGDRRTTTCDDIVVSGRRFRHTLPLQD